MVDDDTASGTPFQDHASDSEALQRSLTLLNTVQDGIYQLDDEGRFVAVNDVITKTTGYTRNELLGEHVSVLVDDVDVRQLEREIQTRLERGDDPSTTFDLAFETTDGDRIPCELRFSLLVNDGELTGTVGVVRLLEDHERTANNLPSRWETYESISSVIDEADIGVFVLDETFDVVWINETIEDYFGLDRTDVIRRDKRSLIRETIQDRFTDPDTFAETVLATYDDNTYVEQFECQITASDDRNERWLEHRSKPIESGRYEGGRIELYYDITSRKEAERARRDSERRLRHEYDLTEQILETSPVGIAVVNPDGSIARANERMADLLNLSSDAESYTTAHQDVYDENDNYLPIEERPVFRVFETGEPASDQEVLLKPSDGERRWLSINARPISNEHGEPAQVVETATDITDLKELAERRKQDLEEREKELGAVKLATNLLESGDQPVDQLVQELVTALPQFFQHPERTAARVSIGDSQATTEGYWSLETRISSRTRTVNGTPITIDVVLHEDPDQTDRPDQTDAGAVRFLEDEQELIDTLTTLLKFHFDRREYITDLRESNKRLEQFAYAASHDLQEPLRMVSSYLQLIERRYADTLDDDGEEFLAYAIDGAERMREMIGGLLEYSRVETRGDPFETIDLDAVIADVLDDLRVTIDEHDADISVESLPTVQGDVGQLRQVFQNLLDNAIEYSGNDTPRVHVSADRNGDDWTITVRDEGIGIDPDDADRVFEVFQRLHTHDEHAGSGIGLALCRRIIERHNGKIWLESDPGEGAAFSFTLPAVDE
ncbi:PAS domain S-box protein [Natrialbaceae archaeon A-CW3]